MSTPQTDLLARTFTAEEFEQLPADPYYRYELSKGRVVREAPPGAEHGRVARQIAKALEAFVEQHELGSVEMETGYRLSSTIVRGPDVSFIVKGRLPAKLPAGYWPFAPDLAIEIVSPSNRTSELETKVLDYLDAGTRIVWVIDPKTRTARVYVGTEARIIRENEQLSGGDVVPGFAIPLRAVLPS